MSHLRRPRLAALAAAAGAALLLGAAPSLASEPGPSTPLPNVTALTDLVQEPRPGSAGMPKSPPPSPTTPAPSPVPPGSAPRPAPTAPGIPPKPSTAAPVHSPAPAPTKPPVPTTAPGKPAPAPTTPVPAPPPVPAEPAPAPSTPAQPTPSPMPAPTQPPPAAPTQPPPPVEGPRIPEPQDPGPSELMARVIELTNRDRAAAGCDPVVPQAELAAAAQGHADDMSHQVYFSHTSLDGRTFDQRIRAAGYQGTELGENIASGFPTAEEVEEAWMSTPGHRRNILDCSFREIGVGFAEDGEFWVVNFGG